MTGAHEYPVIILCGGQGTRLRPLTENIPKPLVEIGGRPILSSIIDHLLSEGIKQMAFCVGYKGEMVAQYVTRYCSERGIIFSVVDSGESADIAERIRQASRTFPNGLYFCYGDTIANVSLHDVAQTYKEKNAVAVFSVFQLKSSFGVFMDGAEGAVTSYVEKPFLPYWINIGYGFLGPHSLELLQQAATMEEFISVLRSTGRLYMHRHTGTHITFNTLSEKEEAEDAIRAL